jgi:riboflavin kinase/FMN adenylyltransferase
MKIYHHLDEFVRQAGAITTTGTFDGVHRGHKKILEQVVRRAHESNTESVVLTFYPHPRMVLYPEDHGLQLLNTLDEKIRLIAQTGIGHLIIHPFTKEFARTTATEFVKEILINRLGTRRLVIGYDHHFGRHRQGSIAELKELAPLYDFRVEEIAEVEVNQVAVSSTKIRKALIQGDLSTANAYLGYPYLLTGRVKKGQGRGRQLGFPTANLQIAEGHKLIPATGIYYVRVSFPDTGNAFYHGLLSIGHNPTFGVNPLSLEVYILDFDKDIYDEILQVEMIWRLRPEMKFETHQELIRQMAADEQQVRDFIRQHKADCS